MGRPAKPQAPINWGRVLVRTVLSLVLLGIVISFLAVAGGVTSYAYIASQLPPAEELKRRQFHFRTSTIYDRNGNVLWEINDPNFGRRTDVSLADIAPDFTHPTLYRRVLELVEELADDHAVRRGAYPPRWFEG